MDASEIMVSPIIVMKPNDTLARARKLMLKHEITRLPVIDENETPIGIITQKDMIRAIEQSEPIWRRRPIGQVLVQQIMTKNPITVDEKSDIVDITKIMIKNNISGVLVTDDSRLIGLVTKTDIVKAFPEIYSGRARVEDFMAREVKTADRGHPITHIIDLMNKANVSRIVIVEGERPIGMITSRDLTFVKPIEVETGLRSRRLGIKDPQSLLRTRRSLAQKMLVIAEDVMSTDLVTVEASEDLANAARLMILNNIGGLPVISNGDLVGIITKRDILRSVVELGGKHNEG
ncbi:MAG: CBS domain-containing protein [Candidatus Hodarchaeota archaeon]